MAGLGPAARRQGGLEQVLVTAVAGGGGLGGPDRVQDREVVGVGQGLVSGLDGRQLLAVVIQHCGEHAERVAR